MLLTLSLDLKTFAKHYHFLNGFTKTINWIIKRIMILQMLCQSSWYYVNREQLLHSMILTSQIWILNILGRPKQMKFMGFQFVPNIWYSNKDLTKKASPSYIRLRPIKILPYKPVRLCSKTNYYFEAHLIAWDNDFLRHDNMHTDVRRYNRK